MIDFVGKHQVVPVVSGTVPAERGGEAFDQMDKGSQFGKLVVVFSRE